MNLNKSNTPRSKCSKYPTKTQNSSITNRSVYQYQHEPHQTHKKESRSKIKKESTEQSNVTSERVMYPNKTRPPFTEIYDNSAKFAFNLNEHPLQQSNKLKALNQQLQSRIDTQAKEILNLRQALASLKRTAYNKESVNIDEGEQLRHVNHKLQKRFEDQSVELQVLQNQIYNFKEVQKCSKTPSMKSSLVGESKVSRRAELAKFYEANAEISAKQSQCQHCVKHEEELEQLRSKYGNELRRLQSEISLLKQKEFLLEVLQLQVQNKNQCIDYLRTELQKFQSNSQHLLNVVNMLENRLCEKDQRRVIQRSPAWRIPEDSFHSFNDGQY